MARPSAKDFVIKIESAEGSGTFITLGTLQNVNMTKSTNAADETNKDTPNNKTERVPGRRSMSVSGQAFFDAGAAWQRLTEAEDGGETPTFQIYKPNDAIYQGRFVISGLDTSGGQEGSMGESVNLDSAGDWTRTPL